MQNNQQPVEAYRLFFPLGLIGGCLSTALWIFALFVQKGWMQSGSVLNGYPAAIHSEQIVSLFFLPIITGFLFTGLPRFTGTPLPSLQFLSAFFAAAVLIFPLSYLHNRLPLRALCMAFTLALTAFSIIRIRTANWQPRHLWLVIVGLALGSTGYLFMLISDMTNQTGYFRAGRLMLYYGMMPGLIFGIGSRLIVPLVAEDNTRMLWKQKAESIPSTKMQILSALFLSSFLLDTVKELIPGSLHGLPIPAVLRFIFFAFWLISYFHIMEFKKFGGPLRTGILVSCWFFLAGSLLTAAFPAAAPHFGHVYFVGGISLLVILVMVRVTLSHSGQELLPERKSIALWIILICFIGAALTRATAHLMPTIFYTHLAYASFLYITALCLWFGRFGRFFL